MADYSTRNLIDYAMDEDGVKFREELYGAIHDKVAAHIAAAKQAVAQNILPSDEEGTEDVSNEETEASDNN
jgi:hypothetical protein